MDYSAIISVMQTIAVILSVRLYLLLAIVGGFVLSFYGLSDATNHSLWLLGIYFSLTVLPLVYLDVKTRSKPG